MDSMRDSFYRHNIPWSAQPFCLLGLPQQRQAV